MSRAEYLSSSFDSYDNKYDGKIIVQSNHKWIYEELSKSFIPADAYNKEVLDIATNSNLNLCIDKTIIIFTKGMSKEIINSLKFHLYMNFMTNWRPYEKYIRTFVDSTKVTFGTVTIDDLLDDKFQDLPEKYKEIRNQDILFVYMNKPIQRIDVYRETAKSLIESRDSEGLITIIFFLGTELEYENEGYENRMLGVNPKRFFINCTPSKTTKENHKNKIDNNQNTNMVIDSEESFQ